MKKENELRKRSFTNKNIHEEEALLEQTPSQTINREDERDKQLQANLPGYYSQKDMMFETKLMERVVKDIDTYLKYLEEKKIYFESTKALRKELLETVDKSLVEARNKGYDIDIFKTYQECQEKLKQVCLGHKISPSKLLEIFNKTIEDVKSFSIMPTGTDYANLKQELKEQGKIIKIQEENIIELEKKLANRPTREEMDQAVEERVNSVILRIMEENFNKRSLPEAKKKLLEYKNNRGENRAHSANKSSTMGGANLLGDSLSKSFNGKASSAPSYSYHNISEKFEQFKKANNHQRNEGESNNDNNNYTSSPKG